VPVGWREESRGSGYGVGGQSSERFSSAPSPEPRAPRVADGYPQPPHAQAIEGDVNDEAGQEPVRPLIEVAHAGGEKGERNPVGAVAPMHQGKDQRTDSDRQPGGKA